MKPIIKKTKSIIVLVLFFATIIPAGRACEICGCSSGGNMLGILPQYRTNFIGLRYTFRQYHTTHPPSIIPGQSGQVSEQYYHTLELWGRFYPTKRLQLFAFVPVQFNRETAADGTTGINTIGDISVMANYIFYQTADSSHTIARHLFQGGVGVKMPTGRYDLKNSSHEIIEPTLQPGTGSWDFTFNLMHTVRWGKWGLNSEFMYKLNTFNPGNYKFGDKITAGSKAFYMKSWKKITLLPGAGVLYEHTMSNTDSGSRVEYTGGNVVSANVSVDLYFKRFVVGVNTQIPCYQDLSAGYVYSYPRANAQFLFMF